MQLWHGGPSSLDQTFKASPYPGRSTYAVLAIAGDDTAVAPAYTFPSQALQPHPLATRARNRWRGEINMSSIRLAIFTTILAGILIVPHADARGVRIRIPVRVFKSTSPPPPPVQSPSPALRAMPQTQQTIPAPPPKPLTPQAPTQVAAAAAAAPAAVAAGLPSDNATAPKPAAVQARAPLPPGVRAIKTDSGNVYRWTDSQGRTQYSNELPVSMR